VTNVEFGAKQLPPFTGEARVTIRDDVPLEATKAKMFQNITSAVASALLILHVWTK